MTTAALTPRVRVMVVCDDIKPSRVEDGVFNLRGVRHYIAAPSFPFIPRRLWLYLLLSSPRKGRYPGYVQIIDDRLDRTIWHRAIESVPVFDGAFEFLAVPVRLTAEFSHPGRYTIQVWFFRQEAADVIKAEQPFDILQEV